MQTNILIIMIFPEYAMDKLCSCIYFSLDRVGSTASKLYGLEFCNMFDTSWVRINYQTLDDTRGRERSWFDSISSAMTLKKNVRSRQTTVICPHQILQKKKILHSEIGRSISIIFKKNSIFGLRGLKISMIKKLEIPLHFNYLSPSYFDCMKYWIRSLLSFFPHQYEERLFVSSRWSVCGYHELS